MLWNESFQEYLLYERNYASGTVRNYRDDVIALQNYGEEQRGELTPECVDADLIRDWMLSMMEKGIAASTVNRKLCSIRAYFRFLLKKGVVKVDPMQRVVAPKAKKPLPVFLKEKDMDCLLDREGFGTGWKGERDHLILEMFYVTGMRRAELIGLRDADIDFGASVIKVLGKRNKQRLIPFGEELRMSMTRYIDRRDTELDVPPQAFFVKDDGRPLTISRVETIVKRNLSKVVTVKKRSPHVLRHTFATALLNHGADLMAVKELLGHASIAATEVYTHTTFEELQKVYKQAHPRA